MVWEVEVTDEFVDWWSTLTIEQQEAVTDRIDVLAERGPDLGRPIVDRIHASRHEWAVPLADDLYDEYLEELRNEVLI